ncbi:MAG: DUF695 domain-containing protein [Bacteroidales bacterium]|nr:DUF695 domain-containing protein [Bacteroidales bacterium]MBD5211881.1 DUF695 domain-containing protein [Bacteroidales bacterium]MBD5218214.1 DUF695 domain-containing protein [Bacteroidales bacterium]MBD5222082.1 DUF695 domain-containing protein [Bacteroidales bacterium]
MKERWWTYPAVADNGKTIIVTARDGMQPLIDKGKHRYRIDVDWDYTPLPDGMPSDEDAKLMGEATDAMIETFAKDPVAVMTGIYTGDGRRTWVFYAKSLGVFGNVFNRALADLPQMPLLIEASEDPGWEEYLHTKSETYIPEDDTE